MKSRQRKIDVTPFRNISFRGIPLPWSPWLRLAHDYRIPLASRDYRKEGLGDHALHYFLEGDGSYELDGAQYRIVPHSVALVRPGHGYHFLLKPEVGVRMLNLHFDIDESALSYCLYPCPSSDAQEKQSLPPELPSFQLLSNHHAYEELFHRLHEAALRQGMESRLLRKALLLEIISLLFKNAEPSLKGGLSQNHQRALDKVVERINAKPSTPMSLEEMASCAGVSRALLCRLFRDSLGTTPQRFLLKHRMELASAELLYSDTPIKDIAARCGFPDVHHFTRLFKKVTGLPPAKFREKHQDIYE